eukprot:gene22953-biopygen23747
MSGRTVVVNIDNQSAMYKVGSRWGPVEYLPLLRQTFFVCAKHDIRLQPKYINTKDNLLADLLSRLDMARFMVEHKAFLRATIWRQDRDDWMVCPSKVEDGRVRKFDSHNAWGNLPFSIMLVILEIFQKCKRRQQWGTAACFLVPVWDGNEGREPVKRLPHVFKVVRERAKGTHLFTAPDLRGHGRTAWGPTRWPVVVVHVRPEPVALPDWAQACGGCHLTGGEAVLGRPPRPVIPLTLADLATMALLISMQDLGQEALWAAILVGFFGLLRKDNLTTGKTGAWNTRGALAVHGSLLCPVRAVRRRMERTAGRPGDSALFVMEKVTGRRASVVPMTHDALVAGIKALAERV